MLYYVLLNVILVMAALFKDLSPHVLVAHFVLGYISKVRVSGVIVKGVNTASPLLRLLCCVYAVISALKLTFTLITVNITCTASATDRSICLFIHSRHIYASTQPDRD